MQGLELPKNRRRLPKKARARAAEAPRASGPPFPPAPLPRLLPPRALSHRARAVTCPDSRRCALFAAQLVHPYEPVAQMCLSQGLDAPPAPLSNVGNRRVPPAVPALPLCALYRQLYRNLRIRGGRGCVRVAALAGGA